MLKDLKPATAVAQVAALTRSIAEYTARLADAISWCEHNCEGTWQHEYTIGPDADLKNDVYGTRFTFELETDRMKFKLMFAEAMVQS